MDIAETKSGSLKTVLDDQPWGQGRWNRDWDTTDPLGFGSLAELIADLVARNEPNITVGVYGDWGSGKTSLMRMVESWLARVDGVTTVWFDAWEQHHLANPLLALCTSITDQLEGQAAPGGFAAAARGIVSRLCKSLPISGVSLFGAGVSWDRAEELATASREHVAAIRELREMGRSLSQESDGRIPRIVVLVDNLDRCSAESSVRLLESIKLVFGEPGFVFLLGVMPDVIEAHVAGTLSLDHREVASRSRYLDKLIQLTFRIPSPSPSATDAFVNYLCREISVPSSLAAEIRPFFRILALAGGTTGTPRSMKRFMNEWAIGLRVIAGQDLTLLEESGPQAEAVTQAAIDRACCLGLRYCWPSLHRRILVDPSTVIVQLREAANVLEETRLIVKRLVEIAESVENSRDAQAIREGVAFRGFLGLSRVRTLLRDVDRVRAAMREPTAPLDARDLENPYFEMESLKDESGGSIPDAAMRFTELSLRYQLEPTDELASQMLSLISTSLDDLERTAVGNALVRLSSASPKQAARGFEMMEEKGKLDDWLHASQYVLFLLTTERDSERAAAVMNRFDESDAMADPELRERWLTCKAILVGDNADRLFEEVEADPDSRMVMTNLLSALTFRDGLREDDAQRALWALSSFTSSDADPHEKRVIIRATGDLLARGIDAIGKAAAALFWSLYDTDLWDGDIQHNLAVVMRTDLRRNDVALALWTLSYSESRTDERIRRSLTPALADAGDKEAALAVVRGQPLPDEESRIEAANTVIRTEAWDDETVANTLELAYPADWRGLLAAAADGKARP